MVLQLADRLEVPLRNRNQLLLAAGHAPVFEQHDLEDPEMAPVRQAIDLILDGHDPYPAVVIDRAWEMLGANRAVALLIAGVAPELMEPPVNVLRLSLHPEGVAPRIANLGEWRGHLLDRLERQIALTGDPALAALMDEVSDYPGPERTGAAEPEIAVPLRLRSELGELSFISTVSTFWNRGRGHGQRAVDRVVLPRGRAHGRRGARIRGEPALGLSPPVERPLCTSLMHNGAFAAREYVGGTSTIGFVLVLLPLSGLVRLMARRQRKKWGGAPKQKPGKASSGESTTAWHSGRSPDGPGGL